MVREGNRTADTTFFWGRVLSLVALVFCVPVGIYFVSIAVEFVGIVLGILGYAFGARRLGRLAVVGCTVAMFLGLLIGQGVMAGSYDRAVDGVFRFLGTTCTTPSTSGRSAPSGRTSPSASGSSRT